VRRDSLTGVLQDAGLDLELDLSLAVVQADPDRMHQVVANLLTNAAKFTPREGRVCLVVHAAEHSAYLEVTDTGEGCHITRGRMTRTDTPVHLATRLGR
jgi:signal transduction histidine kinase